MRERLRNICDDIRTIVSLHIMGWALATAPKREKVSMALSIQEHVFRISEADGTLDKLLEAIRKDA